MKTKKITYNGGEITCREDGSIFREHPQNGARIMTFGSMTSSGYYCASIMGETVSVHKLMAIAFLGEIPINSQVDHINGNKTDNRPSNLRFLTPSQNLKASRKKQSNTSSKYIGVNWHNRDQRWRASVVIDKKQRSIGGNFVCQKAASLFRDVAARKSGYELEGLNFPWIFNIQPTA